MELVITLLLIIIVLDMVALRWGHHSGIRSKELNGSARNAGTCLYQPISD